MTQKRYATPEQIEAHRSYNREYARRRAAGLTTRRTPPSVTASLAVPTLAHEYDGVCISCHQAERCYKGLCAFCRSFANIRVTDRTMSTAGSIGAGRSPWAKANH